MTENWNQLWDNGNTIHILKKKRRFINNKKTISGVLWERVNIYTGYQVLKWGVNIWHNCVYYREDNQSNRW